MRKAALYGLVVVCVCILFALSGPSAQEIVSGAYDPFIRVYVSTSNTEATGAAVSAVQPTDAETRYGVNVAPQTLLVVDKATAALALVRHVGTPIAAGLAFNPETGLLFATDPLTADLVTIDPKDGTTILVGNTGVPLLHGLARDPADGALYATNAGTLIPSILYRLDGSTGAATAIGPIGFPDIGALDFDPTTGILYGARGGPFEDGALITIDVVTGAGTLVGLTHRICGLTFDATGGLYAADNGLVSPGLSSLYAIDKATGAWSLISVMDASKVLGIDIDLQSGKAGGVTLCHRPPGNPANGHTITVGAAAVPAHLEHGDALRSCPIPISASLAIESVTADPAIFFRQSVNDVPGDDLVLVDVMLQSGVPRSFNAFDLEVVFDPSVVQIRIVDWAATPLGDCTSSGSCNPICLNNVSPSGGGSANTSGDLLIGVASLFGCPPYTATGAVRLLTLGFTAINSGTTQIHLVDGPGFGDCEILSGSPPVSLGIPCLSGNATIVATR